jgi:glutamate--cysteine ligase
MQGVCELLDRGYDNTPYADALQQQIAKIHDPELTPSARMLRIMRENGEGFYHFARRMSQQHNEYFRQVKLSDERRAFFLQHAEASLVSQAQIEAADTLSFDEYLEAYFRQA